jgi:acylphosphatase
MATERANDEEKRLHAIVHGRVQGVGFRYSTREVAQNRGLAGYVKNRADGTVEVVVEGPEGLLQEMLAWLERGPSLARVDRVETQWQRPTHKHDRFEVRF